MFVSVGIRLFLILKSYLFLIMYISVSVYVMRIQVSLSTRKRHRTSGWSWSYRLRATQCERQEPSWGPLSLCKSSMHALLILEPTLQLAPHPTPGGNCVLCPDVHFRNATAISKSSFKILSPKKHCLIIGKLNSSPFKLSHNVGTLY